MEDARWLTYPELAEARGIGRHSAERLSAPAKVAAAPTEMTGLSGCLSRLARTDPARMTDRIADRMTERTSPAASAL